MSTRIAAVGAILAITISLASAQGVNPQLATRLVPEKQTVRLGDPINVSVVVSNQTPQGLKVDRSATAFDCFEVTDPDGRALPYVGFDGQVMVSRASLQPFSTIAIADALDLTGKYIFQKAGRYSIRFAGGVTGLPSSPAIALDVTPGPLSEFDQLAAALLPALPNGWHLAKDARVEVRPCGRMRVSGFALHLCHNHMRAEAVYLWFTKTEAKIDPNQPPSAKSEYLGRARGLFVYARVDSNTPTLWSTAIDDISRALQVTKE